MNADIFLDNLEAIAVGPGGVERLRELIREMAVRGKLVEQNVADGRAQDQIGQINRDRGKPSIGTILDLAYAIPDIWAWARFDSIASIESNLVDPEKFRDLPHIAPNNIEKGTGRLLPYCTVFEDGVTSPKHLFRKGQLLYSKIRPKLSKVIIAEFEGLCSADMYPVKPLISGSYLKLVMLSSVFLGQVTKGDNRLAMPKTNKEQLNQVLLPVPPLPEQHRIVEKVDRLMALCDDLEIRQKAEREGRRRLRTASLAALEEAATTEEEERAWAHVTGEFGRLVDTIEDVEELRETVLKLAVGGRLTRRKETDGTAIQLLQQIEFDKKRMNPRRWNEKYISDFHDSSNHTKVPSSWALVPFGQITICRDEERIPVSKDERSTRAKLYDYYGASGIIDKIDNYLFDKPLLLIGEDGANLINRSTPIAFIAGGKYWVNNHAHVIDGISLTFLEYLALFINSIDLKPYVTGTAQPKLNQAKLNSIPIRLPPLAEQHRIVERVNRLMTVCDTLEAGIRARDAALEGFAAAACRAVLGGPARVAESAAVTIKGTGQQRLPI